MPHGLPSMGDLQKFLVSNITPEGDEEDSGWLLVRTALSSGDHLEAALDGKTLPKSLLQKIVRVTWECVNAKDAEIYRELAAAPTALALGDVLKALFRSSNSSVDIITTNYDRIVEYACNSVGVLFQTGFTPGYFQTWASDPELHFFRGNKQTRTARLWKVHGSLDWFQLADGQTIGLPAFNLPDGNLVPQIVTPGLNKYQKTQEEPFRSTMAGADRALNGAQGFLCVGYGFRDEHIHPKINKRCREMNVPTVVLARTLTDEAKSFLQSHAGQNYLGIERAGTGCRVFSSSSPHGVEIEEDDLWSLEGFRKLVL